MYTHVVYWDKQSKDFGIHVDTAEEFVGYLDENNQHKDKAKEILEEGFNSHDGIDELNNLTRQVDFEMCESELDAYKLAFSLATEN